MEELNLRLAAPKTNIGAYKISKLTAKTEGKKYLQTQGMSISTKYTPHLSKCSFFSIG